MKNEVIENIQNVNGDKPAPIFGGIAEAVDVVEVAEVVEVKKPKARKV